MNAADAAPVVLIVDDDPSLARMLRVLLTSDGFDVMVAHNGREALDSLRDARPSLVILDLQMPVMDGRTFFKELKRTEYHCPVIILSAYNAEAARKELGAEAALAKPFDPDAISLLVRETLKE